MTKVKYKEASERLQNLARPNVEGDARMTVGMEKFIGEYFYLDVEKILPYHKQARTVFNQEELELLAQTIQRHGIRQPLAVIKSPAKEGFFEVISGERRLRAAKIAGLQKVPCIIVLEQQSLDEIALIENLHRSDLHPVEFAQALNKIISENPNWGEQTELAKRIGIPQPVISENLKLLSLPEDVKNYLLQHNIRQRDFLRKLISLETVEAQKKLLGIGSLEPQRAEENVTRRSVLRISVSDDGFHLQGQGIKRLTMEEKKDLTKLLKGIIAQIEL